MKHNINKIILFSLAIFYPCICTHASGTPEKRIVIRDRHSLRISHQYIEITLNNDYQNHELFRMKIQTRAMTYTEPNWNLEDERTRTYIESEEYKKAKDDSIRRLEEAAKSNIDTTIAIDKEFFESMYNLLFEVDIKKLIEETTISGPAADGSSATIEYGIRPHFITVSISNQEKKKTTGEISKINEIILEIFRKAGLEDYYD
jgi:hypothetical protein